MWQSVWNQLIQHACDRITGKVKRRGINAHDERRRVKHQNLRLSLVWSQAVDAIQGSCVEPIQTAEAYDRLKVYANNGQRIPSRDYRPRIRPGLQIQIWGRFSQ